MKKTKIVTLLSLILVGIVSVLILTSCGDAPEKISDVKREIRSKRLHPKRTVRA